MHPLQIVETIPTDAHDLPLAHIVTPDEAIDVADPPPPPDGIDWAALPDAALDEMPVLDDPLIRA